MKAQMMMRDSGAQFRKIGFIGLGVMGSGIAKNIAAKSGLPVIVWDEHAETLAKATNYNCTAATSLKDLVESVDVIAVCLPSGTNLEALCIGESGVLAHVRPEQIFVDFGTSPVKLTRELSARFAERGAAYADAPIARGREAAQLGTLSITVGARSETFDAILPILNCAGTDVLHCGEVGCGQIVKIMNNMILVQNVVALAEGLATARAAGLKDDILLKALQSGSADSYALRNHGMKAMWPGNFPKRAFSTRYASKDVGYAIDLGRDAGLDLKGAETSQTLLQKAIDAGFDQEYWPVLLNVIERN